MPTWTLSLLTLLISSVPLGEEPASVRFRPAVLRVGESWTLTDSRSDSSVVSISVEGKSAEGFDAMKETSGEKSALAVKVLEVDGARPRLVRVSYGERTRHADVPMFGPKDDRDAISGRRLEVAVVDGDLELRTKSAVPASAQDVRTVGNDLAWLIPGNPLSSLISEKGHPIGTAITLTDAQARALVGDLVLRDGDEVRKATLTPREIVTIEGSECVRFDVEARLRGTHDLDGSPIVLEGKLKGTVALALTGARLRRLDLKGEFTLKYRGGVGERKATIDGRGEVHLKRDLTPVR